MVIRFVLYSLLLVQFAAAKAWSATDPLPSWNEGKAKQTLIEFVNHAIDSNSPNFIPIENRIATFDQDGTIWVEHPINTQGAFAFDRVKSLAPAHPEWQCKEPFKAILEGDQDLIKKFTRCDWIEIIAATYSGVSSEEFGDLVKNWLAKSTHPRFKRPYTDLTYKPMLEVMEYFRANGFKTFIVSGGGQEFIRVYSKEIYGIPTEQVVGSSIETKYEYQNGKPVLMRLPKIFFTDDKEGKAIGINLFIGKKPYAAFGNADGDRQMLEWTESGPGKRVMMLVLHDDPVREYAYGPAAGLPFTKVGAFSQELMDEANKRGWIIISMKNDWKQIFAFEESN